MALPLRLRRQLLPYFPAKTAVSRNTVYVGDGNDMEIALGQIAPSLTKGLREQPLARHLRAVARGKALGKEIGR